MKQLKFRFSIRSLALIFGLLLSVSAFAQQIAVKGHVKDAAGEPIIGATVRVAGESGGVVTDFDGNFQIKANAGQQLNVSYIGYKTKTAAAAAEMVITLEDDAQTLSDLVVIGYGAVKKSDLTGSVTAMKPDSKNKAWWLTPRTCCRVRLPVSTSPATTVPPVAAHRSAYAAARHSTPATTPSSLSMVWPWTTRLRKASPTSSQQLTPRTSRASTSLRTLLQQPSTVRAVPTVSSSSPQRR